jgi:NADH-quinone oxidoreductase subunit F
MLHLIERLTDASRQPADAALLDSVARGIQGKCLCALGEFSTMPVLTALERFPGDFPVRGGPEAA